MKLKYFLYPIIFVGILFNVSSYTGSIYTDSGNVGQNYFKVKILPILDFYAREDEKAVGFEVKGISDYEALEYKVRYLHNGIEEVIHSVVTLSGQESFKEEWIVLGTCSDGGVCTYDEGVTEVKLTVNLKDNVVPGVTKLTETLSF